MSTWVKRSFPSHQTNWYRPVWKQMTAYPKTAEVMKASPNVGKPVGKIPLSRLALIDVPFDNALPDQGSMFAIGGKQND